MSHPLCVSVVTVPAATCGTVPAGMPLALSVRQPWAWALCAGHKDVENRTWSTDHRGLVLVHATRRVDTPAADQFPVRFGLDVPDELVRGAVIGTVELVDVVRGHRSRWAEPGDVWHWVVRDARLWDVPVAARGQRGRLFDVDLRQVAA